MNDRNLVRGLFLMAIALAFGLQSLHYHVGQFGHAGPGLFPLGVSVLLGLIAALTIARSRFVGREPLDFSVKNIAIILTSLCVFALTSKYVNMTLGIIAMVFIATLAGTSYSVPRNIKICAVLLAIAFGFQKLLGLNLPLL